MEIQREKDATEVARELLKEARITTGNGPSAAAEMKHLSAYQKREIVLRRVRMRMPTVEGLPLAAVGMRW